MRDPIRELARSLQPHVARLIRKHPAVAARIDAVVNHPRVVRARRAFAVGIYDAQTRLTALKRRVQYGHVAPPRAARARAATPPTRNNAGSTAAAGAGAGGGGASVAFMLTAQTLSLIHI